MKNLSKYGLGTFTYREQPRKAYTVTGSIVGGVIGFSFPLIAAAIFVSPVLKVANAYAPTATFNKPVVSLPSDPEHVQIENYIKSVFGKYSDTAFQLLTDPRCHENGSLNPSAENDNTKWGGVGRDWGIFQINDTWQKVQPKFLLNWRINVQIAYQLFVENGHRFNLWTCGKVLGI